MKDNFEVIFSPLPHFGETILEQTYALSTQRETFLAPSGMDYYR
jgi:hypothetical protein